MLIDDLDLLLGRRPGSTSRERLIAHLARTPETIEVIRDRFSRCGVEAEVIAEVIQEVERLRAQ